MFLPSDIYKRPVYIINCFYNVRAFWLHSQITLIEMTSTCTGKIWCLCRFWTFYRLPPKPKSTFRHLKQGIQDIHRKYVLVPADKAANNVVFVWRLHYINTLKQELSGTKAYKETSEKEKSVVNGHCNHLALKFSVCVKERQDRLPTMY